MYPIYNFLKILNVEIKKEIKSGFLKRDYFTTWDYNYQSEVHSRVLGIIARIWLKLGFDIEIERGFNYKYRGRKYRFRPDISIYKDNKLKAFIEYESTNSSDERFFDENRKATLECMQYFSQCHNNNAPPHWIVIFTLPKRKVNKKNWKSYEINRSSPRFSKLVESPFNFYFPKYIKVSKRLFKNYKICSNLWLLNVDDGKVKLEHKFSKSNL